MAKVLVVDDDAGIRQFLLSALTQARHEVLVAADGWEAVELATREWPDLIFMDLMMPILDGLTAARILKENPHTRHAKIIAVSAKDMEEDSLSDFDVYLPKPYRLHDILSLAHD